MSSLTGGMAGGPGDGPRCLDFRIAFHGMTGP